MQEYILWGGIFIAGLAVLILTLIMLIRMASSLPLIKKLGGSSRLKKAGIVIALLAVIMLTGSILIRFINTAIVLLHVMIFWLVLDLLGRFLVKERERRVTYSFWASLILTFTYMLMAAYWCFSVKPVNYVLHTSKASVDGLKVVFFADSHLGTTISGEGLNKYIDMINSEHPDVVLIPGDFVDDGTSRENMIKGCEALSHLETTYGVYYSFGNHDKGYSDVFTRGFSGDDLIRELEANGVVVLEDEAVLIDDSFYIVGRQDKSEVSRGKGRDSASEVIEGLDMSRYIIVLDHQPGDYDAEAASHMDLVVSGHTHGGQLIPFLDVGVWLGVNDAVYGYERRESTDFIVTSGLSDWELFFKSGCRSEYVVIEIQGS